LAQRPKSFWYPHATLRNVPALERLSIEAGLDLLQICRGQCGKVADIGAADGDLAFFLEKVGFCVEIIDNEHTNFNRLAGARILKEALHSSVVIRSIDLDWQFGALRDQDYDAVFFLGILYHLKNPFLALETLAQMTRYCFLSTRIARQTPDGHPLSPYPVAYLLSPRECNNDATNFWILSEEGLERLIDRAGWRLLSCLRIGNTANSNPVDPDKDERAFCLLQSRNKPSLIAFPNPVPAGKGVGMTTVSWCSGNHSAGKVFVSVNGGEERLFAAQREGSASALWIQPGSTYEFRLYDSAHRILLASVCVTRAWD
jgi:tRNA (mo5U34)-methyltransferase